jgi:hypothetical protein
VDRAVRVLVVLTEGTATDPAAAAAVRLALDLGRHLVGVMDAGPRAGAANRGRCCHLCGPCCILCG